MKAAQAAQAAAAQRWGIAPEEAREVIDRGGKLSHFQLVGCRVRWFSEGMALGSEKFLRRVLEDGVDSDDLKPLPVEGGGQSPAWYSLSRLRRQGIG